MTKTEHPTPYQQLIERNGGTAACAAFRVPSWRPEVIADAGGKWTSNRLRFATKAEAEAYLKDLFNRWTLVTDTRAVECHDAVNYRWTETGLVAAP